jgi:succinoglycan biosynthesis transport protein ExoP
MIPGVKKQGVTMSDVVMYLAIVAKHQRMVILLFCFSLMAGLTYYVLARPTYLARSLVRAQATDRPMNTDLLFRDDNMATILGEIVAPQIVHRTAVALGLNTDPKYLYTRSIGSVSARITAEHNLELTAFMYTPELARVWNETMVREYLAQREEKRIERRDTMFKTYTNEMQQIAKKIEEMRGQKQEFQDTNETINILVELDELKTVPRDLAIINKRLSAMDQTRKMLEEGRPSISEKLSLLSASSSDHELAVGQVITGDSSGGLSSKAVGPAVPNVAAPAVAPSTSIVVLPADAHRDERQWQELDRKRWALQKEVDDLSKVYLPANPKLKVKLVELEKTIKAMENELEQALKAFNLEYAHLVAKRKELETDKMPKFKAITRRAEQMKDDYGLSQSGALGWAKMYEDMSKGLSAMDFGFGKNRLYLQYIGHTELRDEAPISPNRLKILLYALGLGFALGVGVPFLLEFLDHTVTSVEEVESSMRIRGLGIIPKVEVGPDNKHPLLLSLDDADRHLTENFRVLRTNLAFTDGKTKTPQVIMVASAMPKEGKTVISSNLAVSFSQKGEKTILIDADLRRGRLHRVFQIESGPGLSDCLMNGLALDQGCHLIQAPNLYVMPCGKHINGATELLGSPLFASLLTELRKKFDKIIVDTPPVLGLSETSMMQSYVDGVLFVISSENTPMRSVKAAVEALQANGANFLGFVLNRLDLRTSTNYYNYYYYSYHYYDDYGVIKKS